MKSGSNRPVVDREWLAGLKIGQSVVYEIHSGSFRSPIESRGRANVVRAGKRHLEIDGVFNGQIPRDTGRSVDGRGRTIVLKPIPQAATQNAS